MRCSVTTARCVQVPVFLVFAEAIKNAYKVLLCTAGAPQPRQCVCPVTLQRPTNETSISLRRRRSIFFSLTTNHYCVPNDLNPSRVMDGARSRPMASPLHVDIRGDRIGSYRLLKIVLNSVQLLSDRDNRFARVRAEFKSKLESIQIALCCENTRNVNETVASIS